MDFARPDAVVSTAWLADHREDAAVRILDGTYVMPWSGRDAGQEYRDRHIPRARFFDIDAVADRTVPLPHMLPPAELFAEAVGGLGIGNRHRVIVYDSAGLMSAARVWWMFRVFGHDAVAVLDGGLPKWLAEGRPVTDLMPEVTPERFVARFRAELVRDRDQVRAVADRRIGGQLVDARSGGRFDGSAEEPWPGRRRGHIPGSRNLPFTDLLSPTDQTLLPADTVAQRFAAAGVDPYRPVIASCGSGVTACVLALGLHLLGRDQVAVYDGSWAEWGLPSDLPVALGPAGAER